MMWHQVEQAISDFQQDSFQIESKQVVSGGDISQAYCISGQNQMYFVKINDLTFFDNFRAEALALNSLALTNTVSTPKVIDLGLSKAHTYLILEFVEFSQGSDRAWFDAGCQLAQLHQVSRQPMFGFEDNNFIGKTPQFNRWQNNWSTFFSEQRIGYQLELLAEKQIKIADIDEVVALVHNLLKPRKLDACLLHGDLWRGNIGFSQNQFFLYDPACYYGDYETDLAMTELFGAFPQAFYQGYYSITEKEPGYEKRRDIYNFYHILNHANIFAGSYIDQAKQMLRSIAQL